MSLIDGRVNKDAGVKSKVVLDGKGYLETGKVASSVSRNI